MYIFASFEHGALLEIAIADLTRLGLSETQILAVPLRSTTRKIAIVDKVYRADGYSVLDGAAMLGTLCMLFGVIFGSVLYWGPVIWGVIGLFAGSGAGLALDWVLTTRSIKAGKRHNPVPVILLVRCDERQIEAVEKIIEEHQALGMARLLKPPVQAAGKTPRPDPEK